MKLSNNTYLLNGEVNEEMFNFVCSVLFNKNNKNKKPINFLINSGGGDVSIGLAICELIKSHGNVIITVIGRAESMAAIIVQSAKYRQMYASSYMMIHQGIEEPPSDIKKNIRSYLKISDFLDSVCDEILLGRIQKKHKSYSWVKFKNETIFDVYLNPNECLYWGLIDKIINTKG